MTSTARSEIFDLFRPWLDAAGYTPDRIQAVDAFCDRAGIAANDNIPARPAPQTGLGNAAAFFDAVRDRALLGPTLSETEVSGCQAILRACGAAGWLLSDSAYALATAFHETAGTMQPIREYGGPAYFMRMYDIHGARPAKAHELGNLTPGDGAKYCGRGYVQLTGKGNYARANDKLRSLGLLKDGEDLVASPDLAMRPDLAAAIMVSGMRDGWFTGQDLDDSLPQDGPATAVQFARARYVINGRDKAEKIAGEAVAFQQALIVGGWK